MSKVNYRGSADDCVVPVCFRDSTSQVTDPIGVTFIEMKPCCCVPHCYALNAPFVTREKRFLADPEGRVGITEVRG
jgi:hypothetical protein